jgi:dsDNA-specific endonuclease/ATPase MutS2
MTISGEGLLKMLGEGKMPKEILEAIQSAINESGYSENIFNIKIPVEIDYEELDAQIKRQSANEFTTIAERVKKSAEKLKEIPKVLERISALLLVEDFCQGVSSYIGEGQKYPTSSRNLHLSDCENIFLESPAPISFQLDDFSRCSILTGANSGGKTTLLEHIIQTISLFQLGLPMKGEAHMPFFSEVYYFAKNKGSASKGAFETLLTQMSKISPGEQTLILADEIEAVTEPGVAGKIIAATADFFIRKNCFLVIATHLGHEISKTLPPKTRIDGIEAKGLDKNFNLIVDHNPVMGRLAHSTPELIVERMANYFGDEYFKWLNEKMKKEL